MRLPANRETTNGLLDEVICVANIHYDGHLTLFKFTTNWKATFRTEVKLRNKINDDSVFVTSNSFHGVLLCLLEAHESGKYNAHESKKCLD